MRLIKAILISAVVLSIGISCMPPGSGTDGDSTNSTALIKVGSYIGTEVIKSVFVKGNYLYAASGYDGLIVFSITNPSNITKVTGGSYVTNHPVNDVVVVDDYAYVAFGNYNGSGGVGILDVSDPSDISNIVISNNISGMSANALELSDDQETIYVADEFMGLVILTNVHTGTVMIEQVGQNTLSGNPATTVKVDGNYAYLSAKEGGVFVVNLTGSTSLAAQISTSISLANAVDISDQLLVIGDRMSGVMIYDVESQSKPRFKSNYDTSGDAFDVVLSGTDIIVADGANGIMWISIAIPTSPELEGFYSETEGLAYRLYYSTSTAPFIYAAYGPKGIRVFQKQST